MEGKKILIVDDEKEFCESIKNLLEDKGLSCSFVYDGGSILSSIEKEKPDLIILDIMMPGIDGFEVCQRIKHSEDFKDIPVILLTVLDDKENVIGGLKAGANDYITKPFDPEGLITRIETHLKIRELSASLHKKIMEQLQVTLNNLQEERDKRIRAERDAVWKDVAFKAAHKLGNPVYAIETDLQSLKKRIKTTNSNALQIVKEIGESLEKVKLIIAQFKSLTKIQEISLHPIDIVPLVQNACRIAKENGIKVEFHAPDKSLHVMADSNRITECFDEIIANALHWFDKSEKKIIVTVNKVKKDKLPKSLDQTKSYLRIRFEDNGCGVPLDKKEEIFIPFYTTHPHGTGIGLSLVQRIIEGHNGLIQENGKPGKGASFEIYLPVAIKERQKR